MRNATITDCSLAKALERADQKEKDLPHIIQVDEYDWDTVVLAKEVWRLRGIIGANDWK